MIDSRGARSLEPLSGDGGLRLVIADYQQLFRECLAGVLATEKELEIVGKFATAQEAMEHLARTEAEVLLLGIESLGDGVQRFVRDVRQRHPALKVILLGREETDDSVVDCLEAGANGYLMRDQPLSDLRSALDVVARGEIACSPRVAHSLFQRLASLGRERRRREKLDFLALTPRELEILRLIAAGLSNQEIAKKLFLSVHTVKNHVHKILETIGVHSRWAAVRHAVERGWINDRRRS
ncbi:MAG TPA: response regulator transcription factor [Thermoanaerobaculia bacterium]|nr:response regulator transcription factor [Thermoanaerobaculia bacterium]